MEEFVLMSERYAHCIGLQTLRVKSWLLTGEKLWISAVFRSVTGRVCLYC